MDTVLLVGFPNSGKSTLFNLLCDQDRKVSNYSGVTVDAAKSDLRSNAEFKKQVCLIDLPGTYNLSPASLDESVTTSFLLGLRDKIDYNLVALVVDIERMEASLSLAMSLKKFLGENIILIVNKNDNHAMTRKSLDKLQDLTGLKTIATTNKQPNQRELDRFIRDHMSKKVITLNEEPVLSTESIKFFQNSQVSIEKIKTKDETSLLEELKKYHVQARDIVDQLSSFSKKNTDITSKIDRITIHPLWGNIIFFGIFYLIFHSIYTWAGPVMDLIDSGVGSFSNLVSSLLPAGLFQSLIVDGIIAGVGGVIIFVPQIVILFFLFSLLEQSGYISRAAVLTDKVMGIFGLNGKAFLPYMSGFACSIPGIMAARSIPSRRERLATIMTIPLITCSARLPVYILIIGTFVPNETVFGFFNTQALSFFLLYFLGSFFALFMALIFRLTYFKGATSSFFIDLPLYQRPSFRIALKNSLQKGKFFVKKAGTIILMLSIIIWFASTFPKPSAELTQGKTEEQVAAISLEHSILGTIGKTIEPVLKPIGMDWKMGISLLVAFGARELFVSTMGTIYALGDVDEESDTLRQRLLNEKDEVTGEPIFNFAVAWSILIFFVFSLQCTSTIAIMKRETGGWSIPLISFVYMTLLAYIGSFIVYNALI